MLKRKKEMPIWFKIQTIGFLFFSGAVVVSYFGIGKEELLIKLLALLTVLWLVWFVSLFLCCRGDK
jgi:hypothetical protein